MDAHTVSYGVDWAALLAPITEKCPAGESLRYEGTYDRIQEARRADDPDLPQGIWKTALKKADWPAVQELCLEALQQRSKDLHIAVWLLEAWFHLYGLAGVQQGMTLLQGLCERFWDHLYPEIEADDVEYRLAPFEWLNEKLALTFKQLPMTRPSTADVPVYTWADWESAVHLDYVASKDRTVWQAAEAEGKVTQARFYHSAMLSPRAFYLKLSTALHRTLDTIAGCEEVLQPALGARAPSLWQCKEVFVAMQRLVDGILAERGEDSDGEEGPASTVWPDGSEEAAEPPPEGSLRGGPIRNRAEAYQRLQEAADYLLRTEPHSPTPYLVKRAVSWGHMTLVELLQELVGNEHDRRAIYALLGIKERG